MLECGRTFAVSVRFDLIVLDWGGTVDVYVFSESLGCVSN